MRIGRSSYHHPIGPLRSDPSTTSHRSCAWAMCAFDSHPWTPPHGLVLPEQEQVSTVVGGSHRPIGRRCSSPSRARSHSMVRHRHAICLRRAPPHPQDGGPGGSPTGGAIEQVFHHPIAPAHSDPSTSRFHWPPTHRRSHRRPSPRWPAFPWASERRRVSRDRSSTHRQSWPWSFAPQHRRLPSSRRTHEWDHEANWSTSHDGVAPPLMVRAVVDPPLMRKSSPSPKRWTMPMADNVQVWSSAEAAEHDVLMIGVCGGGRNAEIRRGHAEPTELEIHPSTAGALMLRSCTHGRHLLQGMPRMDRPKRTPDRCHRAHGVLHGTMAAGPRCSQ